MTPRDIEAIRRDHEGSATLRNLVSVLDAKLSLASHYGVYEYEAGEEGHGDCSRAFQQMAADERRQINVLLELLLTQEGTRRFRRKGGPGSAEEDGR